jgi:hypothetical protein
MPVFKSRLGRSVLYTLKAIDGDESTICYVYYGSEEVSARVRYLVYSNGPAGQGGHVSCCFQLPMTRWIESIASRIRHRILPDDSSLPGIDSSS